MTMQTPELRQGTLKAFDNTAWTATVQLTGSLGQWLTGVPVSRDIGAGDMVAGRKVAVAQFDPANPADAVVFAVWV